MKKEQVPLTVCLKDTVERFLPCWDDVIAPAVRSEKRVFIAAHGNNLRALVKYLDNIPDDVIPGVNIPAGMPFICALDYDLRPIENYYLGDPEKVKKAVEAVASHAKVKK